MGDTAILAGTLDLLILKTLSLGVLHGYGIAQHIQRMSKDALQRMQVKGWVTSEVKRTPTGRTARYYRITAAGRKQLSAEESEFRKSVAATTRVLRGAES